MKIQLLYFPGCPNVELARGAIQRCLEKAGFSCPVEEIDINAKDTPLDLKGWGSPTVLINGTDVCGAMKPSAGASCRIYDGEAQGAPSDKDILRVLRSNVDR